MSAVTPDLYRPMYSGKVMQFFDKLLDNLLCRVPIGEDSIEALPDLPDSWRDCVAFNAKVRSQYMSK